MQIRCSNCFEEYSDEFEMCPHCGYVKGEGAKEPYHLYPGTVLNDRYIIGQVLGFGGFGITYKAWDKNLNTVMAIKEYYPSGLVNRVPDTKKVILFTGNRRKEYNHGLMRFLDEARSMAKFSSHKNIINIFEYFEENNTAYIVMEFLDGVTLGEFLKENRMDTESCLDVIREICTALKDVHKVGIVHRDISPDNIFLCTNGVIKLIDFGAARFSSEEEQQRTIILKPGFAPPEQYESVNIRGPWTDIYALGATMYYMLTGVKPEESTNRKVSDTLPAPHEVDGNIPEYVSNTVMQAMAIHKHMRFASIVDLEKALNQEKKVLPIKTQVRRRKNRRIAGLGAALLVIAISFGMFFANWNKQKEEETLPAASISVAFSLSGDESADNAKKEAFSSIVEAFQTSFPDVTIDIRTYPEEEYESQVRSAIREGKAPTLFETTGFEKETLEDVLNLEGVVNQIGDEKCYFLDDYSKYFPDKKQFPLGFKAPVVYVNKTLTQFEGESLKTIDELLAAETTAETAFVTEQQEEAKKLFLSGKAGAYLFDTTVFFEVQNALPARYHLVYPETEETYAEFTELWSINPCSINERKAAERFLEYLVSDNAQDFLHIRNRSNSLPINKYALGVYCEVYNDFEGFFENIDSYKFSMK